MPAIAIPYPKFVPMKIGIVGNEQEDILYSLISGYKIQKLGTMDGQDITVTYGEEVDGAIVRLTSNDFTIDNTNYRIDCLYQISFWAGAWQYIIMFEMIGILLCAAAALINTKETLAVYN